MTMADQPLAVANRQAGALNTSLVGLAGSLGRLVPALIGVSALTAVFSGSIGSALTGSAAFRNGMLRLTSALETLLEPLALAFDRFAAWAALKLESPEAQAFFANLGNAIKAAWEELAIFSGLWQGLQDAWRLLSPPALPGGGGGDEGLGTGGQGGFRGALQEATQPRNLLRGAIRAFPFATLEPYTFLRAGAGSLATGIERGANPLPGPDIPTGGLKDFAALSNAALFASGIDVGRWLLSFGGSQVRSPFDVERQRAALPTEPQPRAGAGPANVQINVLPTTDSVMRAAQEALNNPQVQSATRGGF